MKNSVKDHDLFGHLVALNFNRGGDTHTTSIGGCCSIIIKIAIMYYVAINVIKLVTFDDDKINLTIRKLDLNEEGPIEYKGNDPMLFWTMKYTKNGHHVLMLDDEYLKPSDPKKKPYLNINFYQEKVDWNKYDSNAVNPR